MKIVVIGGDSLIGEQLENTLRHRGHNVLATLSDFGSSSIKAEDLAAAILGQMSSWM